MLFIGRIVFSRLYEIVFFISSFLYLFFALFLFTHQKGNRRSNRLFAWFCLFNAFYVMNDLCHIFRQIVYSYFPAYMDVIFDSSLFLMAPFLYFYTGSLTSQDIVFKGVRILHFIPFIADVLFRHVRFFMHPNVTDVMIQKGYFISYSELWMRYMAMDFHVIVYVLASLVLLFRFRSQLKNVFLSIQKFKLFWLYLVLIGFAAVHLLHLSKLVFIQKDGILRNFLGISMHVGSLMLITVVIFKSLKQPGIFGEFVQKSVQQKYAKTALTGKELALYSDILTRLMESEKPYLDPSFSLSDLAEQVKLPPSVISQVLNLQLCTNFYHFINQYRVEEIKRLIVAVTNRQKSILQIAYESGFNSKTTFNTAFKKHTGMTPREFVQSQRT